MKVYATRGPYSNTEWGPYSNTEWNTHQFLESHADGYFQRVVMFNERVYELNDYAIDHLREYEELI